MGREGAWLGLTRKLSVRCVRREENTRVPHRPGGRAAVNETASRAHSRESQDPLQ